MICVNYIESQLHSKEDDEEAKTSSSTSTSLSFNIVENKENYKLSKLVKKKNCHYKINKLNTLKKKNVCNSKKNQSRIPSFYCKTKRTSMFRNKST